MKFGTIVATMESLAEGVDAVEPQEELAAQETATEVAEVAGETAAADQEIANTDAAIGDAFEAGDNVAELAEIAKDSLGEGEGGAPEGEGEGEGLSEGETAMVEVTVESIMGSIGLPYERNVYTPESFAGKSRRETTIATLEGLMDKAKDIGGKIVAALKAALNTVMNFLYGLLKNRALMDKHLVNLQEKVKAIDATAVQKEPKLKAGAKALSVGGKASVKTASVLLAEGVKVVKACGILVETLKTEEVNAKGFANALNALTNTKTGHGILAGDRTIHISDGDKPTFELASVAEPAQEIDAPSAQEMTKLLAEARTTLASLREMEKTQTRLKDAVNAIIARVGEGVSFVKSKIGTKASTAQGGRDYAADKQARIARSLMSKAGGALPAAVFAAVKGVADYVTAGVNNYGGKAEEKKADDKKADDKKADAKK